MMKVLDKAYVDGKWVDAASGATFAVISECLSCLYLTQDPATGAHLGNVPNMDEADCLQAVEAARLAFPDWSRTSPKVSHYALVLS